MSPHSPADNTSIRRSVVLEAPPSWRAPGVGISIQNDQVHTPGPGEVVTRTISALDRSASYAWAAAEKANLRRRDPDWRS